MTSADIASQAVTAVTAVALAVPTIRVLLRSVVREELKGLPCWTGEDKPRECPGEPLPRGALLSLLSPNRRRGANP